MLDLSSLPLNYVEIEVSSGEWNTDETDIIPFSV